MGVAIPSCEPITINSGSGAVVLFQFEAEYSNISNLSEKKTRLGAGSRTRGSKR